MSDNVIAAKCECGNKVDINILDHLTTIAKPVEDRKSAALMGMGTCMKCSKDIWIYSYIEIHEPKT